MLLRNAAVQLLDCHGNAAEASGVEVRFQLRAVQAEEGAVLPELCAAKGADPKASDPAGRAFFGDLSIAEGTGALRPRPWGAWLRCRPWEAPCPAQGLTCRVRAPAGRAPATGELHCELVCEAMGLYPCSSVELQVGDDGWATCWSCPVLFSDNASR